MTCAVWSPGEMKTAALALAVLFLACSSSETSNEPACEIAGLYTVTGEKESGDCADLPPGTVISDVFTVKGDEATLTVQGFQGSCTGKVAGCKWTASCQGIVAEPLDPNNDKGTIQYSYTFTKTGLTGTFASSEPPSKQVPKGCSAIVKVTGTKR